MAHDPKYSVREPNIEDATNLVGALLRSAGADTLKNALSGFNAEGTDAEKSAAASEAMVMLMLDAMSNPGTRDDVLFVLADLWQYEPANLDEPPDEFDYDADPAQVARGQAMPREAVWRSRSRVKRKRFVKRTELGKLPLSAIVEFVNAFKETVDVSAFLGSLTSLVPAGSGNSATPLHAVTDGQTDR